MNGLTNGLDRSAFNHRSPQPLTQAEKAFVKAMNESEIQYLGTIRSDGRIHRFETKKRGRKNGWYVFFGSAGAYGDWSRDIHERWSLNKSALSQEEKDELERQIARSIESANAERTRREEEVAEYALKKWMSASEVGSSPYLDKKKITPFGIRFDQGSLVIPIKDVQGRLWSLQYIQPNGDKRFLRGGRKKGCFHLIGTIEPKKPIIVAEGYATGVSLYMATENSVVVAFDAGNLDPVIEALKSKHPKRKIILAGDDDCWGMENTGRIKAEAAANKHCLKAMFPQFKNTSTQPTDFNDLHVLEGLEEVKKQICPHLDSKLLKALSLGELLSMDIKPREMLLDPIIPEQGLVMIHAPRGIGKTHVSLMIAFTVAVGETMFQGRWACSIARRVLFVDGEMPLVTLQERLTKIVKSSDAGKSTVDNLRLITPDIQDRGIPDLSSQEGQKFVEEHLERVKLLILDNYSALCRGGRENEAESWIPLQEWFLKLRKRGISVLLIHHSNKNGGQRGTSKKEDLLDTVITLKKPEDYDSREGARFEVHYEKARGFCGEQALSFEASLREENKRYVWTVKNLEDCFREKIANLSREGFTQREIAQETGLSPATVNRRLREIKSGENQ